jgi:hypothetical protein
LVFLYSQIIRFAPFSSLLSVSLCLSHNAQAIAELDYARKELVSQQTANRALQDHILEVSKENLRLKDAAAAQRESQTATNNTLTLQTAMTQREHRQVRPAVQTCYSKCVMSCGESFLLDCMIGL